jgi:hypothetical protein
MGANPTFPPLPATDGATNLLLGGERGRAAAPRDALRAARGDWETGRLGAVRLGDWETGRLGDWETGRLGDWER